MITKGEIRRLEGSSDWTSELRVYRADDRLVRLQQVEAMYYEDGDDDYYYDGGGVIMMVVVNVMIMNKILQCADGLSMTGQQCSKSLASRVVLFILFVDCFPTL